MTRHEQLAHLSREHHQFLIVAQLLKKGAPEYARLPKTVPGKLGYAMEHYESVIKPHIEREEAILFPAVAGIDPTIDQLIYELQDDHVEIETGFQRLEADANVLLAMDSLGHLLDEHVRKEERQFFELLQKKCPEILEKLDDRLKKP